MGGHVLERETCRAVACASMIGEYTRAAGSIVGGVFRADMDPSSKLVGRRCVSVGGALRVEMARSQDGWRVDPGDGPCICPHLSTRQASR